MIHTSVMLWDGYGCYHANNNCCNNPDISWFYRKFSHSMNDYLEANICHINPFGNDDTLVESIELYIQ